MISDEHEQEILNGNEMSSFWKRSKLSGKYSDKFFRFSKANNGFTEDKIILMPPNEVFIKTRSD